MEQVSTDAIKRLLRSYRQPGSPHRNRLDWDVFNFKFMGVPQKRKRIIAGSPELIARLRRSPKKRAAVRDFIQAPRGTHIRNECLYVYNGRENRHKRRKLGPDDSCLPISGPSHTIVAKPLRWVTPGSGAPMLRLTPRESACLQALPMEYALPETSTTVATRAIGNAVPPPVITQMLAARGRPVSPTLLWRPP